MLCGSEAVEEAGALLQHLGDAHSERRSDLVGAPGVQVFRLLAKNTGAAPLSLIYRRPWEEGAEPLATFRVDVVVR